MKTIDAIIIHCSATRAGQDLRAKDIDRMHKQRGFSQIGYNFVIDLDGMVENGRPLSIDGAHCNTKGFSESSYNRHSIGICYIGGLDASGKPADTRTPAQRASLRQLVASYVRSMILSRFSDIVTLRPIWTGPVKLNQQNTSRRAPVLMFVPSFLIFFVIQ